MPVLYPIVGQVQKTINESIEKIDSVYITGTAALINNIDLYFQEYLESVKCEILKPGFVTRTADINIKDYIEVNSAIAIALMGLGEGVSGMNFKKTSNSKIKDFLKIEIGPKEISELKETLFTNDLKLPLNSLEKKMLNVATAILILLIVYSGFSLVLKKGFEYKGTQADQSITNSKNQIALIEKDDNTIKKVKNDYTKRIENLQEISKQIDEKNRVRGAIPGLLNQLMNVIPNDVKINSIENTEGNHIRIAVESPRYEQIAFLIGSIKTDVILTEVISTSGQKTSDVITVTIEGDLP